MTYSQAPNRRDAVASAKLRLGPPKLQWHRLETASWAAARRRSTRPRALNFAGMSTRAAAASRRPSGLRRRAARRRSPRALPRRRQAYKVLPSNGQGGGPWSARPGCTTCPRNWGGAVRHTASRKPLFGGQRPLPRGLIESQRHGPGRLAPLYLRDGTPNPKNLRGRRARRRFRSRPRRRGDLSCAIYPPIYAWTHRELYGGFIVTVKAMAPSSPKDRGVNLLARN